MCVTGEETMQSEFEATKGATESYAQADRLAFKGQRQSTAKEEATRSTGDENY